MERWLRLVPMLTTRPEGLRMPIQMKAEPASINTMEPRGVSWDWIFQALKRLNTAEEALVYPRMERRLRSVPLLTT